MTHVRDPAVLAIEDWPQELAFVPYVGQRYLEGWNGHRVLLLGESHYRKEGLTDRPEDTRPFTKNEFAPMANPGRTERWGGFWDALDRVLVGEQDYTPSQAAAAWERVAFVNQCQVLAGTKSFHRPSARAMGEGCDLLQRHVLPLLQPTIVLVLGRFTWRTLRHGKHAPEFKSFVAEGVRGNRYQKERSIWRIGYEGGTALMTWVYHPSWHIDTWEDRAGALRYLLKPSTSTVERIKDDT